MPSRAETVSRFSLLLLPFLFLPACGEDPPLKSGYAGSESCRSCHEEAFVLWAESHHGLAERPLDPARDRGAFPGPFRIETMGLDGENRPFEVVRVIGEFPLRQYLIEGKDGRQQVADLSFDPHLTEWFNAFGDENRRPHEWGFWANRGMTWNSMCADCHNTDLRKHYDFRTDSYATTFQEMGVGCEACHGEAADHVDWQQRYEGESGDPTLSNMSPPGPPAAWVETCGGCHSLRSELKEQSDRHAPLLDSFLPEFPNLGDIFYADGQVRGENYEYAPFLMSRMHFKNVVCFNCHEPHAAKLRLPDNELCLTCHRDVLPEGLVALDPAEHSHHDITQPGGQCVNCHMPLTTYMQRHPRRDHGLTIPDPLLTLETGTPNACNRCHTDQTVEWAQDAVVEWYGEKMQRRTRERALRVARARKNPQGSVEELVAALPTEEQPAWRGITATLLGGAPASRPAREALGRLLEDDSPLVRTLAAKALPYPAPETRAALRRLLDDPLRAVRITAAWTLRSEIDLSSRAGSELMDYLQLNSDQPSGALMLGSLWLERGDPRAAVRYFEKASLWEPYAAAPHQNLALALSRLGLPRDALLHCKKACELEPKDPEFWFSLGLAHAELGETEQASEALEEATRVDPNFDRAFYNLGLAKSQAGDPSAALSALERATALRPDSADYWFALAAVARDAGQTDRAIAACEQALRVDPRHAGAGGLLRSLRQ
ncbi:MAG: ammonia-forming cytochrome c nitrite reductase subunit c552 [Planctomycetota bacterium]